MTSWTDADRLTEALASADAVLIGAGAGLSTAAGLTYTGARFDEHFADFRDRFGITDMYTGGFFPFPDRETYWAWWSRHILLNRYDVAPGKPLLDLLTIVRDKDYFALTTNVDHQFQLAGFDKERLFYTQGDYGLFQCSRPCRQETFDNEQMVRSMVAEQRDLGIPSELIPTCPHCGAPLTTNLRVDDRFVQDAGWHAASERYAAWLREHEDAHMVLLELGVGGNTPVIIKYPFWRLTAGNANATYACVNLGEAYAPPEIGERSLLIDGDIAAVLANVRAQLA